MKPNYIISPRMSLPDKESAVVEASRQLADWLDIPEGSSRIEWQAAGVYASMQIGELAFLAVYRRRGDPEAIAGALSRISEMERGNALLIVPYMSPAGRKACKRAGVSWLDLSGNARILAPGIHILVEGRRNRFAKRGRAPNVFAPKSSRVARWLLMHPHESFRQTEISAHIDLDEGTTSRVVRRLLAEGLLERSSSGKVRASDPDLLLDTWRDSYDFGSHRVIKGHVPGRSGEERLFKVSGALRAAGQEHAATGLSAAWLCSGFAGFRLASFHIGLPPDPAVVRETGFHEGEKGANLWLVLPREEGVWLGASDRQGVRVVHPIQAYLDLQGHPERSEEAAEQLRAQWLSWGRPA
ncbi:MAG: MarR family transcriptional regulator [Candidatus Eisenbacteria bacterium]|nr:MarR family transcriptional regulator [Candidatus Eisenbacteria bacterium]